MHKREENADTGPVQPIKHRDGSIEMERVVVPAGFGGAVRDNPWAMLAAALTTALTTAILSIAATLGVSKHAEAPPAAVAPAGASSVQIESVLTEVKGLTQKVDDLRGDVRSIKEADLSTRVRACETALTTQAAYNAELNLRRANYDDFRKTNEITKADLYAKIAELTSKIAELTSKK